MYKYHVINEADMRGSPEENKRFCELKELAASGDASAQCELGAHYYKKARYKEAVKWLRPAAEHGHAEAQLVFGDCYREGDGVPRSIKQAKQWYEKAAERGYAKAQVHLGDMYMSGEDTKQDHEEALKWYRLAAGSGDADAQFNLGVAYSLEAGVERNYDESERWYKLAAEQGHTNAMYALGLLYVSESYSNKDIAKGLNLLIKAARLGCEDAMIHLKSYRFDKMFQKEGVSFHSDNKLLDFLELHLNKNKD